MSTTYPPENIHISEEDRGNLLEVVVLKDVIQVVFYFLFRYGAEQFVDLLSVLEENHGGRAHDIVLGCGKGILIYIDLSYFDLTRILGCQLIKDGIKCFTVGAHGGVVFHENRAWKSEDFLIEVSISNEGGVIIIWNGVKRCMAFATFGLVVEQILKKSVLYTALRTFDDQGFWLQNGFAFAANGVIFQSPFGDSIFGAAAGTFDDCAILIHAFSRVLPTE
jgi:hypothetical protein